MSPPASAGNASLPLSLELRLEAVCSAFEAAWKKAGSGEPRPRFGKYLGQLPELERPALALELLRLDAHYRRAAGEQPQPADYLDQLSGLGTDQVAQALSGSPTSNSLDATGPYCSLAGAAGTSSPLAGVSAPPGYVIEGQLGRGGMGVVYKAHQVALKRTVALKMIRSDAGDPEELARFQAEAEAVARLQHPHIVQIFEVGQHDGRPFFSLEYVDGGSLAQRLDGTPWLPRQAAMLVETLAQAVQAAHAKGVIHRDLKPANVLLPAGKFIPKVTDFGLAKQIDDDSGQTRTGQIMGTPSYMAPEQASGKIRSIGPATDVYALGAILYELLTGRSPFRGASVLETLEQVRSQEPVPPRQLQPKVPRDLETICLKCLQKEPARRYPSARALAAELKCFLEGRPIQARPVGAGERLYRWCRRNPAVAALTAAIAVLLVVSTVVASGLAIRMYYHADRADRAAADANDKAGIARTNEITAGQEADRARQEERTTRHFFYAAQMARIADAWDKRDPAAIQQMLAALVPKAGQEDLRGPEWYYFWRQVHGYQASVPGNSAAFLDGGRTLVTGGQGAVKLWDAATGKEKATLASNAALRYEVRSTDTGLVVLGWDDQTLRCWTSPGDPLRLLLETAANLKGESVTWVVAPDGRSLAVAIGPATPLYVKEEPRAQDLKVWDLEQGKERFTKQGHMVPLAYAPDGQTLAVGETRGAPAANNKKILLLDPNTGKELAALPAPAGAFHASAFSSDGQRLLAGGGRSSIDLALWDVAARKQIRPLEFGSLVGAVAVSHDGTLVAAGPRGMAAPIRLWDARSGKRLRELWGHEGDVQQLVFAADGTALAAGCADGTVKVWDVNPVASPRVGAGMRPADSPRINALAYSKDGRMLASAGADQTVKLWDLETGQELAVLRGHDSQVTALAFAPGGRLASGSSDGIVKFWDPEKKVERSSIHNLGIVSDLAFSPDGKILVVNTPVSGIRLRDGTSGQELPGLNDYPAGPKVLPAGDIAYSADGTLLAASFNDSTVRIWELATRRVRAVIQVKSSCRLMTFTPDNRLLIRSNGGSELNRLDLTTKQEAPLPFAFAQFSSPQSRLLVSPEGRFLATAGSAGGSGAVILWDLKAPTWPQSFIRLHDASASQGLAISPDSRYVAAACDDGTVALGDLQKRSLIRSLPGHVKAVAIAAWSADRTIVAEARPDFSVRIQDRLTRQERAILRGHLGPISSLALSRDGRLVLSGSVDRTVRLWDATNGEELRKFTEHKDPVRCVALSPDELTVASGDGRPSAQNLVHGELKLWDRASGHVKATLKPTGFAIQALAFSPDGQTLAVGTGGLTQFHHGGILLFHGATGERLALLTRILPFGRDPAYNPMGHRGDVVALDFSSDGQMLASGSSGEGTIRLWDMTNRRLHGVLQGHHKGIGSVAFAPHGKRLISTGSEGSVGFWNVDRLQPCGWASVASVRQAVFAPDGWGVMIGGPEGTADLFAPITAEELRPYEQALAARPSAQGAKAGHVLVSMLSAVAELQDQIGDLGRAEQCRQRATSLSRRLAAGGRFDDPAELLLLRGLTLAEKGDPEGALAAWREAVRLEPTNAYARDNLAAAVRSRESLDRSLLADRAAAWREAVRLEPGSAYAHFNLGVALTDLGELEGAIAAFRETIQLDQMHHHAHNHLIDVLVQKEDWQKAIEAAGDAVAAFARVDNFNGFPPKDHGIRLAHAGALVRLIGLHANCPDEKLRDPTQFRSFAEMWSISEPPYWAACRKALRIAQGMVRYRNGDWQGALKLLQPRAERDTTAMRRIAGLPPLEPDNWIPGIRDFMQVMPGNEIAAQFFQAMAHWQLDDREAARQCYDQAVKQMAEKKPTDPMLPHIRAEAAALLGLPPGKDQPQR